MVCDVCVDVCVDVCGVRRFLVHAPVGIFSLPGRGALPDYPMGPYGALAHPAARGAPMQEVAGSWDSNILTSFFSVRLSCSRAIRGCSMNIPH